MACISGRAAGALDHLSRQAHLRASASFRPGPLASLVGQHIPAARAAAEGLWRRDPATWSDQEAVQASIANRLGWMAAPATMRAHTDRIRRFARAVCADGFTDVVLLGMGGSSLAPEVLRSVIGSSEGWPRLHVLDSTDPAAVIAASTPPATSLYLLASKSGTTIEPNSLAAHFARRLQEAGIAAWHAHFVAITDEGTALARRGREEHFRDVFINPTDIGGRFSALSYFGLVPAALMGQDIDGLLDWAVAMVEASAPEEAIAGNPAVGLGLLLGAAARAGRDKLTLVLPTQLQPFGLWVEQLVAESTGKNGVGIVPVSGEPAPSDARASRDRVVVRLDDSESAPRPGSADSEWPAASFVLRERTALGAEFVRWEIATAVAGALLHVNPFDEPNVQQAKDATRVLLAQYQSEGHLPITAPDHEDRGVAMTLSKAAHEQLGAEPPSSVLATAGPGDYLAVLAYLGPAPSLADVLQEFRLEALRRIGVATTVGMGPRYLHSTGQLHKGGPNTGVFVVITATPVADVAIPGEAYTFGTLELAQALGDFRSLDMTGRRAVHVHLPAPDADLLRRTLKRLLIGLPPA